jgi:putative DNA primase/helicase
MTTKHPKDKTVKVSNIAELKASIRYPDTEGKKILNTTQNLKMLLNLHKIVVRWNIMLRVREVFIPNVFHFVDEKENADLAYIYNLAILNGMPITRLDCHLDLIGWENSYHPIVQCILDKPWDGIPRLDNFIKTVKTKDDEFSYKMIKRWMLSAIGAAFSKHGFSNQGVLVLQGDQNLGKTRWVKSLDPLQCGAVKEGLIVDPSNKDSVITASQCWIAELGELDGTFSKADIARLKSFITSSVDVIRLPFAPRNSHLHRRTAYVGTVNNSKFLVDDTGNRRWWTIEVDAIYLEHGLDMQQVWAEVYDLWSKDNKTWLSKEELIVLNEKNTEHEKIDPLEEKLLEMFDWSDGWQERVTIECSATQVLEKMGSRMPTQNETYRMGKIITKFTGVKCRRNGKKRLHRLPLYHCDFKEPIFNK